METLVILFRWAGVILASLAGIQYVRNLTVPTAGRDKLVPWPVGTWAVYEVRLSTDDGLSYGTPLVIPVALRSS